MGNDGELLRRYAVDGDEGSFSALVERHLGFVYATALRRVGDEHLAKDISQTVFAGLARKARALSSHPSLVGWLYTAVHYTAASIRRNEFRRRAREHAAATTDASTGAMSDSIDWNRLQPVIDDSLKALPVPDRDILLLRFFKGMTFHQIASTTGLSEEAARKRVARAMERLRGGLVRRGITSTGAALASALGAQPAAVVPQGLSALVVGAALSQTGSATALSAFVMTTTHKILATLAVAAAIGGGFIIVRNLQQERIRSAELESALVDARQREQQLREDRSELLRAQTPVAPMQSVTTAPEPETVPTEEGSAVDRLRGWLARMPDKAIPEMNLLLPDEWTIVAEEFTLDSEIEARKALRSLRSRAKSSLEDDFHGALTGYLNANGGVLPADIHAIAPYFNPPLDPMILQRYELIQSGRFQGPTVVDENSPLSIDEQVRRPMLIAERNDALVDEEYESRAMFSTNAILFRDASRSRQVFEQATSTYAAQNGGQAPNTPEQILPYLTIPIDNARLRELLNEGRER